ncbi:non-ribosomal peptide synthetase [bacterium]|nr:non-ribosomal peptide synthetase [bacterium]
MPEYAGEVLCLYRDYKLLEQEEKTNLEVITGPENLAYVTYTSGSTGNPKGVLSCQKGVVNYLAFIVKAYGLNSTDVVLQIPSLSFDASVRDIIGPLTAGAQVAVVNNTDAKEPAALLSKIKEHRVTCLLSIVPTMLNGLIEAACDKDLPYDSIRLILVSGEALHLSTCRKAQRVFGHYALVVNQYGPTECTMTSTYYPILKPQSDRDIVLIGKPISNSQIYILDDYLNPAPIGVPGQLHIGGVGLGRGYLNRSELTAETFIPNPFSDKPGTRLYKTGDLARWLPDGNIEFLGRLDNQVKLRGFRIELEEIEAVLNQHPAVQEAVVLMREDDPDNKRLVAYVVSVQENALTISELQSFLKEKLPDYMVPSAFVMLDALPLTPNGKVDRRALPAPDRTRPELEETFVAPHTPIASLIAEVWQEVLGVEKVGVYDNFFDLGGHSLLSMQVIARLENKLGVRVNPREFIVQTLGQLASSYEEKMPLVQHSEPNSFAQKLWHTIKSAVFRWS